MFLKTMQGHPVLLCPTPPRSVPVPAPCLGVVLGPKLGDGLLPQGSTHPHSLDAWPGPPSRHCPQQAPVPRLHQDHNRLPHPGPIQPLGLKPRSLPPHRLTIPDRQVKGFSCDHTQTRHPDAITTGPELPYQMFPPVLRASIIAHLVIVCFLK